MRRHLDIFIATAIVLVLPLFLKSGSLASEVLIFALAALGCNLLLGYTGLLSFGQGIFFGFGSYAIGILLTRTTIPMPLALAGTVVLGAVIAGLIGFVSIRQKGTYFVMLTLAFAQMFYFLAYTLTDWTGGDNGLLGIPASDISVLGIDIWSNSSPWQYYVTVAVLFVLCFSLLHCVSKSIFGRTLLAIRDNESRATAVGYNVRTFKLLAFMMSGAITALAGALNAMMTGIAPLASADYQISEVILLMTVIGGTGNLLASVVGAVFYVLAADWLSVLWPRWLMLLGILLIVISLGMQQGLWGFGQRVVRFLVGRVQRRSVRSEEKQA